MKLEQWQSAWQQLIGAGSPFEVLKPADGSGDKYFRHTAASVWAAIDSGRVHGDREFLVWEQQRLTFAQFFDQVDRLGGQLVQRFGVRPGRSGGHRHAQSTSMAGGVCRYPALRGGVCAAQ
jgi:long-chain acyl-CoA synthetase